jgi:hypothetical protein
MHLRVAHRQIGDTAIQCGPDLEHYFIIGSRFEAIYLDELKALYVTRCARGSICMADQTVYRNKGYSRTVIVNSLPEWIPAFTIKAVEFTLDGDLLVWRRPPIWTLGWPQKGIMTDPARNHQAVVKGLQERLRSAKRNGIDPRKVTCAVPAWAKSSLAPGEWMAVVREVFPGHHV